MQLISIEQVFRILKPGVPLPWGVRDIQGRLLLAKGHVLSDQAKLMELINRGMYVDAEDVQRYGGSDVTEVPRRVAEEFADRWDSMQRRLKLLLKDHRNPGFLSQIEDLTGVIAALPEEHNDQMLFMILRHDHGRFEAYSETHSLHAAALCHMISRRLGWPRERRRSLIGAALTMNLAMVGLHAQLAAQTAPVSPAQRKEIDRHPLASAELLRVAGLRDEDWLTTVEQHHECTGGSGYPHKLQEPGEMSQLLRIIDTFSAKHSGRAGRSQQPAHQAARDLYARNNGHPAAAALIKECGIYPPGTFVRLTGGETAVVIKRGANAKQPVVAVIANASGDPLTRPLRRDTAVPGYAIADTISEKSVKIQISVNQLYQ